MMAIMQQAMSVVTEPSQESLERASNAINAEVLVEENADAFQKAAEELADKEEAWIADEPS